MKLLYLYVLISACFSSLSSCAQGSKIVKNTYAYFYTQHRGIVKVDQFGNDLQSGSYIVYVIYIETSDKFIQWQEAIKDSQKFIVEANEIDHKPILVGINKISKDSIVIHPTTGHKIWMLRLIPSTDIKSSSSNDPNQLTIYGVSGDKPFSVVIKNQIELLRQKLPQ